MPKDVQIAALLQAAKPAVVWDIGASAGRYSAIAATVAERVRRAGHRSRRDRAPLARPHGSPVTSVVAPRAATLRVGWGLRLRTAITGFGWYPLMLALASYLQLYAVGRAEPAPAIRSFVIVCAIVIGLTAIGIRLFGRERGSAVAAIAVAALLTANGGVRVIPFFLAIGLLVVEGSWARQGRIHLPWARIHEALTVVVGVMLIIQIWQVVTIKQPDPMAAPGAWADQPLSTSRRPNIYLILADGHGRADTLEDDYGYDDGPFLDALRTAGLEVASSSRSNYDLTRFSLASLLTGSLLDPLNAIPTSRSRTTSPGAPSRRTRPFRCSGGRDTT